LVIVLILAVIPPALVVADMWFRKLPTDLNRDVWCQVSFLCSSRLPSYFATILGCFFILAVMLFFLRRQTVVVQENPLVLFENPQVSPGQMRIGLCLLVLSGLGMIGVIVLSLINQHWPGWDLVIVWLMYLSGWALRAVSPSKLGKLWKKDGEFWISLLLMHIAIVAALAGYYDVTQVFYLALILLVLASANLWRFRRRVPFIFWVASIALVFYTININGWWTAIIGDDQGFHEIAWAFAEKMSFAQVGNFLFQADGVFGAHPYFSSFVQGISMKLFGHGSFGWRFSSLYLCAMGVGLFYFFCKSFLSQRSALIAACLLGFSHYVMTFGKIGYNNLQALFAVSLVLAVAAYALRWKQPFVFALLGSAMALCFYLYPASLYAVPLPILLLLIYDPPKSRQAVGRWLVMFAACGAMIYPLLMQPIYWQTKQAGTLFNNPALVQSLGVIVGHFASNIFYAILSFLYITEEGHYIVASFIDPITAVFIILGYFVLLYQMRRQRFAIFVALAFVFFLFSVGSSHDRQAPPDTRMFMMLPWFALFGMWGIVWLEENIKKAGLFARSKAALVPILLVVVAGANLYQAYKLSPERYAATQSTATLYLAVTENILKAQPDRQKNIAFIVQDNWGFETLEYFRDVYPYLNWFHLYSIIVTEPVLPQDKLALFSDPDTITMVAPYLDPAWQNALDAPLTALGKAHCAIWIPDMRKFLVVYFSPDLPPQVCLFDTGLALDAKAAGGPP
jgi:4-amino-4-deoxy-L-arabinose transferase-like glycosyltransferase